MPAGRAFVAPDREFATRVRASFARQGVMALIGAKLVRVEPGLVSIELPYRRELSQQDGYFHAGITSTIVDSAGGYACATLFRSNDSVLTVEYKINFLAPANGEKLIATGRVVKPGRTLTVCALEVISIKAGEETLCATGQQTLICLKKAADQAARE